VQYQVVGSRLESNERNANGLRVKCLCIVTMNEITIAEEMLRQLCCYEDKHCSVYKEMMSDWHRRNLYVYYIAPDHIKSTNTTVGIVLLKQAPVLVQYSRYPKYEYQAKLLYMDAFTLNGDYGDYRETRQLSRRYESIFGEHKFTKFETSELFERPFQLFNQPLACVSIHEPLSRPTTLSVIVQDPMDPKVSVIVCKVT
jgi:hypothetical protein